MWPINGSVVCSPAGVKSDKRYYSDIGCPWKTVEIGGSRSGFAIVVTDLL